MGPQVKLAQRGEKSLLLSVVREPGDQSLVFSQRDRRNIPHTGSAALTVAMSFCPARQSTCGPAPMRWRAKANLRAFAGATVLCATARIALAQRGASGAQPPRRPNHRDGALIAS